MLHKGYYSEDITLLLKRVVRIIMIFMMQSIKIFDMLMKIINIRPGVAGAVLQSPPLIIK